MEPRRQQYLADEAITTTGRYESTGYGTSRLQGGQISLRGFYETAVECKGIPLVFVLLGVFVFAVAFAIAGTARTWRKIHLGLLYALEESR
jgi:hypothetical protein